MCGIAGIFSPKSVSTEQVKQICSWIRHRGPDAEGFFCEGPVGLGHKRLSIIDLDKRANQPFFSQDQRYSIVFNGEIYNYQSLAQELVQVGISLKTTSDTEVLIEGFSRWGPGYIHKLRGMFAFAIYDRQKKQLF